MKYTRFQDIPAFTREGSWECDYEIDGLVEFIKELVEGRGGDLKLQLDPDFQRAHVWTQEQQIAWVEFFLRGGKTGRVIYLNHPGWMAARRKDKSYQDFVLVDGKQRIRALQRFANNEIKVFGSYYMDYTDRMRLLGRTLRLNVNTLQSKAEVLQWYIQMNSGGTPHSPEEIAKVQELLKEQQ